MSREIIVISKSDGLHHLQVGFDDNQLGSFEWQLWITRFGAQVVDFMQAIGMNFITFIKGDVWIHNRDDVDRCTLFGEKRDCVVGVVGNERPNQIKVYDSLGVQSNEQWEIYEIIIPASLNYPNGMTSKIPTQRFKKRDTMWRAEFLRNLKSTSGTESVIDAISGEPLRGSHIYLKMKNTSNGQVSLFRVSINATLSRV